MAGALFLFLGLSLCVFTAYRTTGKEEGPYFSFFILIYGIFFLALLWLMNDHFIYAQGGDDKAYHLNSIRKFGSLSSWFDTSQFDEYAQAGYAMLLTWLHQFVGDSLYLRKALNVFFFIGTIIAWQGIGNTIGGNKLGYILSSAVLITTPLWFYWLFLLKDMAIVFLQSVYLLGLIRFSAGFQLKWPLFLLGISTIALIPFRVSLVAINLAMFSVAIILQLQSNTAPSNRWLRITAGAIFISMILSLGSNVETLRKMGAVGETRGFDAASIRGAIEERNATNTKGRTRSILFPIVFLVGETTAFSPSAWKSFDSMTLRGLSYVPWIFFGAPLFLIGLTAGTRKHTICAAFDLAPNENLWRSKRNLILLLVAFVGMYAILAWLANDTTRWRIPAFPAMAALAGWGWATLGSRKSLIVTFFWSFSIGLFITLYYLFFK